jgi:hypothetical protein
MPIPTGTAAISFSQIRTEMNGGSGGNYPSTPTPSAPQGTAMSLNDATFRSRLTDTAQNAQLSLSALRGNAYQRFIIAADTTNYNIYSAMSAAPIGWNTTSKGSADVVVNSGIVVGTPSTGTYAMDTGTGWPGPSTIVVLNNGGYIVGMGGAGGRGGNAPSGTAGIAGSAGGPGLRAQRAMTLNNYNAGIVGGGGGGGGGGDGKSHTAFLFGNNVPFNNGGGGGGGGRTGRTNSAGGAGGTAGGGNPDPGSAGQVGTFSGAGAGGNGGTSPQPAGNGGPGGSWGGAGGAGGSTGGAAGVAVQGWTAFVTSVNGSTGISGPVAG